MRKKFFALFMILLLTAYVSAGEKFMVVLSGIYLNPADKDYKEIYGSGKFYPELKLGLKLSTKIYLWVGYGLLAAKGTTPVLELETTSKQQFISGGVGYWANISKSIGFRLTVGLLYVLYREEAMSTEVSDSAVGFRAEGSVIFNIGKVFFLEVLAGYLGASDTIDEETIKLGGIGGGIGLGIKF
jgi:hypothetical protein